MMTRIPWGDWKANLHALFPLRTRSDIFMLLLLRKRLAWPLSKDLTNYLIAWLATRY